MLGWLGMLLAMGGQAGEARTLLGRLHERAAHAYVPPTSFAWILGLGEIDSLRMARSRGRGPRSVHHADQELFVLRSDSVRSSFCRTPAQDAPRRLNATATASSRCSNELASSRRISALCVDTCFVPSARLLPPGSAPQRSACSRPCPCPAGPSPSRHADRKPLVLKLMEMPLEPLHHGGIGALEIGGRGAREPVFRAADSNE